MNSGFTLKECLFGPVKLTKNADPDKYYHWGYGVGFDPCSSFSVPYFDWVRILLFLQYTDGFVQYLYLKKKKKI